MHNIWSTLLVVVLVCLKNVLYISNRFDLSLCLFCSEKSVRIYTVDAEGMLKLNESITTPEAVSSLSFSASGDLFVALAADSSPFQMYSTSNENKVWRAVVLEICAY